MNIHRTLKILDRNQMADEKKNQIIRISFVLKKNQSKKKNQDININCEY